MNVKYNLCILGLINVTGFTSNFKNIKITYNLFSTHYQLVTNKILKNKHNCSLNFLYTNFPVVTSKSCKFVKFVNSQQPMRAVIQIKELKNSSFINAVWRHWWKLIIIVDFKALLIILFYFRMFCYQVVLDVLFKIICSLYFEH